MKKASLFLIIGVLNFSIPVIAQMKKVAPERVPIEKVYLHVDRQYYTNNDDIWFKAYLTDAATNKCSEISNNLYVELVSSVRSIEKRTCIRLDKGLGIGDFHLDDSIPSGRYQIRAYTNWMRNFGEDFFFTKEIEIENLKNHKNTVKPEVSEGKVDVQFFAEGGQLIQDVYEMIGFKAINSIGYGCKVKGKVYSSDGDTVATFESNHLGMGSFGFISKKGKTYFASGFSDNGTKFTTEMPMAGKTGFAFHVAEFDKDNLLITVKTNRETLDKSTGQALQLTGSSHGKPFFSAEVKVASMLNLVRIAKSKLPLGIVRLTLGDTLGRPFGERLYYVAVNNPYTLTVASDYKVCTSRQKVTLNISTRDSSGNPVPAFLSLSAVNAGKLPDNNGKTNIISYLQLESELKGTIEQPSYYFDSTLPDRFKALDNLLLTQGWRDFLWKYLSDTTITIPYPIEKGITVSGRLRRSMINKPIADANISMILFGSDTLIYYSKTDSTGRYYFGGLNFKGDQSLVISASDKNRNKRGMIQLDSLFNSPADVKHFPSIQFSVKPNELEEFKQEAARKYEILKKYHLTDTILLNEVVIKSNKPVNTYEKDGNFRYYGEPTYSLMVTPSIASTGKDAIEILQGRIPGLQIRADYSYGKRYIFYYRGAPVQPRFLINGSPASTGDTDLVQIITLQPSLIDKIEVVSDFQPFIISIFLKKSAQLPTTPVLYSINQKIQGFYQARSFYVPKYDKQTKNQIKPDLRTTVFWEPNITTDAHGNATVSYFNSDDTDKVSIEIQGISESGVPLVGKTSYEVK